ncbi:UDP-4-amino-4,6-dideoxy-N-acetyl-beta-L-altrosamine transaminase [Algoriphagus sp. AGSA1]|uniref:UDP-4-amino-4, 6-dideoxy-N-acetyl-beta-L-altrosamine transaminase n=1 Tax=Algoriphagus sp. AGSA1 TaxID=2907213 RepID=UPI001F1FC3A8|nr:UDP-4-amino-4,6-dideoxy-N-acetyl-beta-L-altrosamine transaminase [Algoriphagus sp. AGSA1]MCE7055306.1 UDP-4-amino-4,6-dideoxy-N-acetyl-beta-L-altrosamine transaminase [Algoriphagus sp. AGSA1]
MMPIPYGRQSITDEDIEAVIQTLKSDYLTQGPKIKEFEEAFAAYIGSEYAVAVSNGTAALHLNCIALGVKPGVKVITTPITFAASANCVRYCGGEVVFADIDPDTYLLDISKVRELLEKSPKGTYSGIIPVDFAGRAVDLEAFRKLADEYGLWIIEDACHAPGGYFVDSSKNQQSCGNGNFADLAIFSFHPVKHIAAGEGGMTTTNSKVLYEKLVMLRTHGIIKDDLKYQNSVSFATGVNTGSAQEEQEQVDYPGWYMEMQELGYNYRLTDIQAALGLSQLGRAEKGLVRRKDIAEVYRDAFSGQDFVLSQSGVVVGHAYHLYVLEVKDRVGLYNFLRGKSIYAQIHYIPTHLMPYYRELGWKEGDMPIAEEYYNNCISLPMYPTLSYDEQRFVIDTILLYYSEKNCS